MEETSNFKYFTAEDNQTLYYFQLPKVLMVAEKYAKLSNDAKLLYSYYLDLNRLSMSHGWKDKQGRYYIKFKNEKAMKFIGCASEKLAKLKKELSKFGLIHIVKMGLGKTNITYVGKLEYSDEDVAKVNELFEEIADDADKTDAEADVRFSNIKEESTDVRKSNTQEFENRTSRNSEIEGQDVRKSNNIYINNSLSNDSIKNEFNENHNLNLRVDMMNTLWDTSLPMRLKQWIKVKVYEKSLSINNSQIIELDEAYQYQISKGWIDPTCSSESPSGINDNEFAGSIAKMLDTVKDIHSMRGLVQNWVQKAYDFKVTNLAKPTYEQSVPFYNWLEQD
jgi:hypothetical protein